MITPNELDAMRQAAINYRLKQQKEKENIRVDFSKVKHAEIDQDSKKKKIQELVSYRAVNGIWPDWFSPKLLGLEYRSISKTCLRYAKKHGIEFQRKKTKSDQIQADRVKRIDMQRIETERKSIHSKELGLESCGDTGKLLPRKSKGQS